VIDLYFWTTPNGYKLTILLEELGWDYNVIKVHIGRGEQFQPAFLDINPNGKVPAMVDHNGPEGHPIAMFESGAIMMYLAEKSGGRFFPEDTRERYGVIQWLMFQMAGIGPMLGQAHHFRNYAPENERRSYAVDRYTNEARRLYTVLEKRLARSEYLAGSYSIADMATFPWIRPYRMQGQVLDEYPNLLRWYNAVRLRPAVQRGLAVLKNEFEQNREKKPSGASWDILFGKNPLEKH
jgi:GST-like protein